MASGSKYNLHRGLLLYAPQEKQNKLPEKSDASRGNRIQDTPILWRFCCYGVREATALVFLENQATSDYLTIIVEIPKITHKTTYISGYLLTTEEVSVT